MKKFKRGGMIFLSVLGLAACMFPCSASADDVAVEINITPDRESYAQGDDVSFDVAVINHSDDVIQDLNLQASISDQLTLTENAVYQMELGAFETRNYTVLAKGIVPAAQTTVSGTTQKPAEQRPAEKTTAPKTGEDTGSLILLMLALGGSAALTVFLFGSKRKSARSLLSLILCAAIAGSAFTSQSLRADAARAARTSASSTVRYGTADATLSVRADYTAADNIIHPNYRALGPISEIGTYDVNSTFTGVTGKLDAADTVVRFTYTNQDAWGVLLDEGEIPIGTNWALTDIGLLVGINVITLTAEQADGTVSTKTVQINNIDEGNMHDLLVDLTDPDGDHLLSYYEDYYGTDPNNSDSDGDGLMDNMELFVYGTDPNKADTDGDGLSDSDEISVYGSSAHNGDTDSDGVSDGDAVAAGLDPTGIQEDPTVRTQTKSTKLVSTEKPAVTGVSVSMDTAGNIAKHVAINNIEEYDPIASNVVGAVSAPVEITSDAEFENATITFTYDPEKLGDTPAENLAVMWYDRENLMFRILDADSVVDTEAHTVSYVTTHFSTYLVVDREIWYDCWRENIDYRTSTDTTSYSPYDIGFCVDVSGSMSGDRIEKAKLALNTFIDAMLPQDNACLVSFESYANKVAAYGTPKESLRSAVSTLYASGGTDTNRGLYATLEEMNANARAEAGKIIVMICDGDVNYVQSTVNIAKEAGIAVYTINVVSGNNTLLERIASETGGQYFYAATTDEVVKQVENIRGVTVSAVDMTDSDGDGLYDVYESKGMKIQNGQVYYSDPLNPDSDGDGVTDYQEFCGPPTAQVFDFINGQYSCVLCQMASSPNTRDTDSDGIPDIEDPDPELHFGSIGGKIYFQLADSIDDFEMPDYLNEIKRTEEQHEEEVVYERYPWISEHPLRGAAYLEYLWLGASATWELGYVADALALVIDASVDLSVVGALRFLPNVHFIGQHNINNAAYMLLYYNSNIGGTVGFDATDLVTDTVGGQSYFNSNMGKMKQAFEQALLPGQTRIITSTSDANLTAWALQGHIYERNELDGWLSLNKCDAVVTAECSFDGTTYTANVKYYVVDRYDFYEPDPVDGRENEVGFINNDGYVILSYYDFAEPFDVIGYYSETITWTKN